MVAPDKSCAGCRLYRRGRPKGIKKWAPNHGTCLCGKEAAPTHGNSSACKDYKPLFPKWEDDFIHYGDSDHDKVIRFDLDQAGIEQREREAIELVELRAEVEHLKKQLHLYSRKLIDAADEIIDLSAKLGQAPYPLQEGPETVWVIDPPSRVRQTTYESRAAAMEVMRRKDGRRS